MGLYDPRHLKAFNDGNLVDKVANNNRLSKSQRIKTDNWLYYCHLTKYRLFDGLKKISRASKRISRRRRNGLVKI